MKTVAILAALAMSSAAMAAQTYGDSSNELFDNGFGHLDILSVTVSHDATSLFFDIETRSSLSDTNWGKYCIGINTGAANPDTTNGWGRNRITWGGQSINYWVGSWADGGSGGEVRQMSGLNNFSNTLIDATYNGGTQMSVVSSGFHQMISFSRASIGMTGNGTIRFDVITTGGGDGDPGVDHLSRSDMATPGWGSDSVAGGFASYTIPAPGALALVGLAGVAAGRRRR